jgi:hypothetical protein
LICLNNNSSITGCPFLVVPSVFTWSKNQIILDIANQIFFLKITSQISYWKLQDHIVYFLHLSGQCFFYKIWGQKI